jgi:hypothetical protein
VFAELDEPRYVYSSDNERVFLNNAKSLDVMLDIYSTDPAVSPVINAEALSIALQSNKLDSSSTVSESVATGNSAESRYITNPITLDSTASELKFMFAVNIPYPSTIELWYRTTVNSSANPINTVSWTQVPLSLESNSGLQFTDIEEDVIVPESFSEYQAKVVFKSLNSAKAPKIKDFRVIALS